MNIDIKFVHAADVHLDSPLRGLERYEGAPVEQIRGATRKAFVNLVNLCIQKRVNFLILAGDLYDGDLLDYQTGLFFANQMSKLREFGIKVYLVQGNHDAQSEIAKGVRLPDNVHTFSSGEPHTLVDQELGVALHGWSYPTRAVTEDISQRYPDPLSGFYNIGILHTSLDGRPGHDHYAPCSLQNLINRGYDYWALGHIHQREIVTEKPLVVFPGNLQGRHVREAGAKGCIHVEVSGGQTQIDFHPLDVVQWAVCTVNLGGIETPAEAIDTAVEQLRSHISISRDKLYAVRFVFQGATAVHHQLQKDKEHFIYNLRAAVNDVSRGGVWIEKVLFETRQIADIHRLLEEYPSLKNFFAILKELAEDDTIGPEIAAELKGFYNLIPQEAVFGDDGLNINDSEFLRAIMIQAQKMIIDELVS